MDNILFSTLTHNPAAIHIDHEYAKTTEFGRPLVNSIFTLGLVIGLSVQDTTLGTTVANLGMTTSSLPTRYLPATHCARALPSWTSATASHVRTRASSLSSTRAST